MKSNSRRVVRKVNHLPQKAEKLLEWVQAKFDVVTSFTELDKGNQITLNVGLGRIHFNYIFEFQVACSCKI